LLGTRNNSRTHRKYEVRTVPANLHDGSAVRSGSGVTWKSPSCERYGPIIEHARAGRARSGLHVRKLSKQFLHQRKTFDLMGDRFGMVPEMHMQSDDAQRCGQGPATSQPRFTLPQFSRRANNSTWIAREEETTLLSCIHKAAFQGSAKLIWSSLQPTTSCFKKSYERPLSDQAATFFLGHYSLISTQVQGLDSVLPNNCLAPSPSTAPDSEYDKGVQSCCEGL